MPLETEVKFFTPDLSAVRSRLLAQGGGLLKPRLHERNVVYDTPDFALKNELKLLRLRADGRVRLTFKGPTAADALSEAKVREEIEVEAADFDALDANLHKLGFESKLSYEKYRETWTVQEVEIVLDELPYGDFVELEGVDEQLKPLAIALGFDWSKRILSNYLSMMAQLKVLYQLPFEDITFANFADAEIDPGRLWG